MENNVKICPFKFDRSLLDDYGNIKGIGYFNICKCERDQCEMWNSHVETCGLKTITYSTVGKVKSI